jgi:aspartate/methionine/tyrosine aminotransferase
LDTLELSRRIGPRSRAIVVVNPNNPTGSYLKDEELARIATLCETRDLALISDEVFLAYSLKANISRPSASTIQNVLTFTLGGFSKLLGLPQMKLGWIQISGPREQVKAARSALELIADSYLSVSTPIQLAAPEWLTLRAGIQGVILDRLRGNLERLSAVTDVLDLEGGWYATIPLSREREEEDWVLKLLADYDVVIQPGFFFDFDFGPVGIVSLLTEPECFTEGIARLAASGCLAR